MQAMIFAAGKGTRLKPLTDVIPKALVPVGDKPLLQLVYERLLAAGVDHVVVNVHHHAEQIKNFISLLSKAYDADVKVSDETSELLETGGGIKKALPLFRSDEPILIHNCDILSNVSLKDFYEEGRAADATLLVSERKTQRYLLFDNEMRLVGWTNIATGEVKSPYPEIVKYNGYDPAEPLPWQTLGIKLYAFSGIHTFSPSLSSLLDEWQERFPIMDFYLQNCKRIMIRGVVKRDLKLLDVGKLDTLAAADSFLKEIQI